MSKIDFPRKYLVLLTSFSKFCEITISSRFSPFGSQSSCDFATASVRSFFKKIQNNFYRDRNWQWRWSINLALSDRQCLVVRILTPGVKRPSTRYCSMVDPSRVSVTPGFLFIKFYGRAILARDRFHVWR